MSSKLVRKGLELVNSERDCKKRKVLEQKKKKEKQPKKTRTTVNDRPRGFQDIRLSSGQLKKEKEVDYTEKNLQYFKKTTWAINKDTYDKILKRQSKSRKKRNYEEKQDLEEESTGLFDD